LLLYARIYEIRGRKQCIAETHFVSSLPFSNLLATHAITYLLNDWFHFAMQIRCYYLEIGHEPIIILLFFELLSNKKSRTFDGSYKI
jgi:hypothetical protein